ncbi:MAG: gamma-glutamylcyclotransferase family protein [Bradymonadaceae bacterium]
MDIFYFAYGSNLDASRMHQRVPAAEPAGLARLENFALAFGGHSPHWKGAPATVVPDEESAVPGRLYRMSRSETYILDYYEGHPFRYERRRETVELDDGDTTTAYVYVKEIDGNFATPPEEYLEVLQGAYEDLGLDSATLEEALQRSGGYERY